MMPKLKVYRTPIGFHDAYVAAPSRKAALRAWGTEKDLFARGAAEEVSDPALTKDALANPGEVIRKARIASDKTTESSPAKSPPPPRPKAPKPDRSALDVAERALEEESERHAAQLRGIDREMAELAKHRRQIVAAHEAQTAKLEKRRTDKEASYRAAMSKWRF